MAFTHITLDEKIIELHSVIDTGTPKQIIESFDNFSIEVKDTINTFEKMLKAVKAMRDAQKAYFNASRAGKSYDKSKYLEESKKLEASIDQAIDNWLKKLTPADPQQKLFN